MKTLIMVFVLLAIQGCNDEQEIVQTQHQAKTAKNNMLNGVGSTGTGPYVRGARSKEVIDGVMNTKSRE